jgi:uncharacterized protein YecT (DUF1311 family)
MKNTLIFLFLLFTSISFSQSATGEDELYDQYEKVDKELNSVYNNLKNELKEIDKKNLIEAQKAWIKFRDLNCKFRSQDSGDGGGPYVNKKKIDCKIQSTMERTKELKSLIGGL